MEVSIRGIGAQTLRVAIPRLFWTHLSMLLQGLELPDPAAVGAVRH